MFNGYADQVASLYTGMIEEELLKRGSGVRSLFLTVVADHEGMNCVDVAAANLLIAIPASAGLLAAFCPKRFSVSTVNLQNNRNLFLIGGVDSGSAPMPTALTRLTPPVCNHETIDAHYSRRSPGCPAGQFAARL